MRSLRLGEGRRAAAACALWLSLAGGVCLAIGPAKAADDGAAPIWDGIGAIFGFGTKYQDPIEYRDHAKLVLPPSANLPKPGANATGSVAWPHDPDVEKRKREKAEIENYTFVPLRMRQPPTTTRDSEVTISATTGEAPGERPCVKGPGESCKTRTSPSINWNPLTWVGLEKKAPTVLGPEPDRDWLTDPPKGYREPAEGESVRMDN